MNSKFTKTRRLCMSSFTKLFLFLLLVTKGFSAPLNGQELLDRKVSVSFSGETLNEVINVLSKEFDVKFTYNSRDLNFDEKVFYSADNEPIGNVLDNIFDPIGISYLLVDDKIALRKKAAPKNVSSTSTLEISEIVNIIQEPIKGVVYDQDGVPLPGAAVVILGTNTGTSDINWVIVVSGLG